MDPDRELLNPDEEEIETLEGEEDDSPAEGEEGADDAPAEGEEGEPPAEGEEGEPPAEGEGEPPPRGRAAARIETLSERASKAEGKVEVLQRQLNEILQGRQQQLEDPQAEAEKLAKMEPHERLAYQSDKQIKALQQQIANVQFTSADNSDRASFQAEASVNPVYKKYEAKVEETLADIRKKGSNAPRKLVLATLIGMDALAKTNKPGGRQQQDSQQRRDKVNGRPPSARGEGLPPKGGSAESRLANVKF